MKPGRKNLLIAAWAFLLPALIVPLYDTPRREVNTNERVRIYLTMALAEEGTTVLDRQVERYGLPLDRAEKDGRIYSDKAPGLSFLAIPSYLVVLLGDRLFGFRPPLFLIVYLARVSTVGVLSALGVYFLVKLARGLAGGPAALFVGAVYLLGTPALPFSAVFFGHQAAAGLAVIAFYLLTTASPTRRGRALAAGLLAGLAVTVEYPTLLIAAALALLLLLRRATRPLLPWMLAGLLPAAVVLLIYNRATFGGWLDFGYGYTDHYFRLHGIAPAGLSSAFSPPSVRRLLRMAFSPYRGLCFFSPVLVFALPGFWWLGRRGRGPEAVVLGLLFIGYFLLTAGLREWEGGWSPGLRHLVPVLPFLFLPLSLAVREISRPRSRGFIILVVGPALAAAALVSILTYFPISMTYLYFPWGVFHPWRDLTLAFLREGRWALTLPGLLGLGRFPVFPLLAAAALFPALFFSAKIFRRICPTVSARAVAVSLAVFWLSILLILPARRTGRGERFLSRIYWDHRLARPFIASAERIVASSTDPVERARYRSAAAHVAREALNDPRRAEKLEAPLE